MRRYVLIDSELGTVAGDTKRFYLRFLRAAAHVTGRPVDSELLDDLTPERAAEVLDILEGDDIGWRYERMPAVPNVPSVQGYEVYEVPEAARSVPTVCATDSPSVAERTRAFLPFVCFVAKFPAVVSVALEVFEQAAGC